MTTVFLVTFLVGCVLTLLSLVLGAVDASGLGHAGHIHVGDAGHAGHVGHVHAGHIHAGDAGHAGHVDAGHGDAGQASTVSPLNYQSLVAFLIGFGGVGYFVSRAAWGFLLLALILAVAGGVCTGWLVLNFMRFLVRSERPLPPTSYVGVVGELTVGIRAGGTGELVYTQHGTRMVTAARTADGSAIAKGEQVIVLRYENGVAYVEPWNDLMAPKPDR